MTCIMSSARVLGDLTVSMFAETYHSRISKKSFTLLPETYNGRTAGKAATTATDSKHREPFLPRIRVEECGLTVEPRDRASWKRSKRPAGKSWKPGKKRREKFNNATEISSDAHGLRDRFLTQEQRDNDSDIPSARSLTNKNKSKKTPSEFVDSLKVGGFPKVDEKSADSPPMERATQWPVGKLAYSSTRTLTTHLSPRAPTTPSKTESLALMTDSPKPFRLPLPTASVRTSSHRETRRMSPRERVLLNKLAMKRKRQNSSFQQKSAASGNVNKSLPENHRFTPIDFDQYLPTTHCMQLATLPNVPTKSNSTKPFIRGSEYYDLVDDATQKCLQQHQKGSSTSSGIGSASSGSQTGNSGSESMVTEWQHDQSYCEHNKNCPLAHDFKPSDVGNFCPPNSPHYFENG